MVVYFILMKLLNLITNTMSLGVIEKYLTCLFGKINRLYPNFLFPAVYGCLFYLLLFEWKPGFPLPGQCWKGHDACHSHEIAGRVLEREKVLLIFRGTDRKIQWCNLRPRKICHLVNWESAVHDSLPMVHSRFKFDEQRINETNSSPQWKDGGNCYAIHTIRHQKKNNK